MNATVTPLPLTASHNDDVFKKFTYCDFRVLRKEAAFNVRVSAVIVKWYQNVRPTAVVEFSRVILSIVRGRFLFN